MTVPRILIIAGSDSGGGAGIQADIKTATMLGAHAMTAVTAITAQNTLGVDRVMPVAADMVIAQVDAVVRDIGIDAVKIGMLGSADVAHAVADWIEYGVCAPVVFDPVMVATSGSVLADTATIAAFGRLLRLATISTPNAPELDALGGDAVRLAHEVGAAVLGKGGDRDGDTVEDVLTLPDGSQTRWSAPRIDTPHSHGTGCTLSTAIACGLAEGMPLPAAIDRARSFVRIALHDAPGLGSGHGPMGHAGVRQDVGLRGPRLNQVTVGARDYDASVAFYRVLGLVQIVDAPPRYARFECASGTTISIHADGERCETGSTIIYFEADDLGGWVELLQAAGFAFDALPQNQNWQWREARLVDPAGNRLCLYEAGENRRFPPWRLARQSREE